MLYPLYQFAVLIIPARERLLLNETSDLDARNLLEVIRIGHQHCAAGILVGLLLQASELHRLSRLNSFCSLFFIPFLQLSAGSSPVTKKKASKGKRN